MHKQKLVGRKLFAFPTHGIGNTSPPIRGDASALPPFTASLVTHADIAGHLHEGTPALKDLVHGFHCRYNAGDELSRQAGKMSPVLAKGQNRTMCPMGRGVTPVRFKDAFAERLKAARIAAGFATQAQFASALAVPLERYKKWESGRTPIPHVYVAKACELLEKDANYLFGVAPRHMPARQSVAHG